MPRKLWKFLLLAITLPFYFIEELILSNSVGTRAEWFTGMLGAYALIISAIYWFLQRAENGELTEIGLEREKGPTIPLMIVEKIVREGGGFPAVVVLANDQVKMHMTYRAIIKLAKTRLNQWRVNGKELTMEPGETRQELHISYAPVGRYDTYRFASLSTLVIVIFVMALLLNMKFGWDTDLLSNASIFYGIFFLILQCYRFVKVSVAGDKVTVKRGKKEESFRISDVTSLERGLFQAKVTTKNGEVFRFPRACILLPELIEEYCNFQDSGTKVEKI